MIIKIAVDVSELPADDDPDYDSIMTEILRDAVNNGCYEFID